jgi:hypothetical protein
MRPGEDIRPQSWRKHPCYGLITKAHGVSSPEETKLLYGVVNASTMPMLDLPLATAPIA